MAKIRKGKNKIELFTHEELVDMGGRARILSEHKSISDTWKRAYHQIEDAADVLDALTARKNMTLAYDAKEQENDTANN